MGNISADTQRTSNREVKKIEEHQLNAALEVFKILVEKWPSKTLEDIRTISAAAAEAVFLMDTGDMEATEPVYE